MKHLTDTFTLNNGVGIPCVGFGTWQTPSGEVAVNSVRVAIEAGYKHIDTATVYQNEADVGIAVKQSGVDRKSLFITSKLWNTERGYDKTMKAFEKTLKALQTDYLDLYLVHWPASPQHGPGWQQTNRKYMEGVRTAVCRRPHPGDRRQQLFAAPFGAAYGGCRGTAPW